MLSFDFSVIREARVITNRYFAFISEHLSNLFSEGGAMLPQSASCEAYFANYFTSFTSASLKVLL